MIPLFKYIYQFIKFGHLMGCDLKEIFKNAPCLCNNTHNIQYDITDLVNHEMVKNTET